MTPIRAYGNISRLRVEIQRRCKWMLANQRSDPDAVEQQLATWEVAATAQMRTILGMNVEAGTVFDVTR
jgi:hypothetical protein